MFISETPLTVRYAETDQMGVAHHSNYAIWFEAGRTDFLRKLGLSYSLVEKNGAKLPLLELKCRFKGFARYEDEIIIKTCIAQYTATRLVFHYKIFRSGEEKHITEGETVHCWTDGNLKPVNLKKYRPEIFELIEKTAI